MSSNRNYTIWWLKNWRRFDKEYRRELCRQKFWGIHDDTF